MNLRVSAGQRARRKHASREWHTLRVDFRGSHFTVTYNGRKVIEPDDTFKETRRRRCLTILGMAETNAL
jgi:hypothetical protein